jgi:acetylornithine/LysW-gamma-L-lysine aminotransferase
MHELQTQNARIAAVELRHGSGVYKTREVALVRGQAATVWDADGREYLDCAAGHGVASLGHCHPAVVEALARQASELLTCPGSFPNGRRARLLERLAGLLPRGISRFFLCNSGTEAVEASIKFARFATRRPGVVAARRAFHGRTMGALSATWEPTYREPFEPLVPGFRHVPFDRLDAAQAVVDDTTAAVLVEVVQGEGGVRPASRGYLEGLRRLCADQGAMLIVDEVQTGFGRTGSWFAFEQHDVVPDLVCLGKAIAGGVPMGAVAIGGRVGDLPAGAHGSTFGGNPLACAAAIAAIDAIETEGLVDRARAIGARMRARLEALDPAVVREVRVVGAMAGVELRVRAAPALAGLLESGVIALPAGPTVIRLLPPLVITDDELDRALSALDSVVARMARTTAELST